MKNNLKRFICIKLLFWGFIILNTKSNAAAGAVAVGFDVLPIEQVIINKYGANSTEYDFIKNIQLGLTIYNGVSAGANLLQLPQKFDEALTYWQANKQRLVNEATVTNEQVVVIDNLLQGASINTTNVLDDALLNTAKAFDDNVLDVANVGFANWKTFQNRVYGQLKSLYSDKKIGSQITLDVTYI